ncbi:NACHT, LRR and PYD domains-containing protein 12-like isoform X2 [Dysidea avara]|uniref:NACHT, LRR and PYD domains-containing protein 12-like isoform X2 n=1 Tax=Dysidea avara TaxID=196820 RepID=UPI003328B504
MLTEDDNWKKEKEVVTKNSTKNRGLLIKHLDLDDALIQNNMFGKTSRQQIQLPVIRRIVDQLSTGGTGTLEKPVCESLTGSKKRSVFTAEESVQERRGDVPQLCELNRHIVPVYASVWKDLGLELEIPMYTLNAIAVDHVNHPSWSTECCKVMLQKWIRMSPRPTWARLQEALEHLSDSLHDSCKTFFSKPNGIQESQGHTPLDAIIKILQVRYIRDFTSDEGEAPVKYIELALVKDEKVTRVDKNLEEFTKLTIQGQVDEILQRKEPLGDLKNIFCYQDKPCPRLILIKGGPGIGKTTLANEICVRWSNNAEFLTKKFDAVILIPLRTVQQQSLEEAIIAYIGETAYQQLKKQLGRRCLLILEGLDEMAAERRKTDPVLSSLVKNESMLELTLLITSRPHACQGLNANRTIEVVGFSKGKIEEYVKSELLNDTQAVDSFIQQLEANSHIRSMCYIPLSLKMIIQIFQYNNSLPSTMTELYRLFIVMTLQREQEKKNTESKPFYFAQDLYNAKKILHEILPDIPEEAKETVFLLSKLAYHAFFDWCSVRKEENKYLRTIQYKDPKVIFTENDLIQSGIMLPKDSDGLGLMKCSNIKHLTSQSKTYNFMHLSMQEFLCALYIVMTFSLEDQYQLIQRHFDDHPNIMILLYGLTGLKCAKFSQYIFFKLLSGTDELGAYNDHVLATVKCICESESSISSKTSSFLTVILNHVILTPYDLVCASHLLCKYPVVTLKLVGCDIGDQGISILVQWCIKQSTQLQELHINANHLTSAGMVDVAKIIRSSPLFKTLYIGDNEIGDVGMGLICKELQNNNTVTTLRAFRCGMSAKGLLMGTMKHC